MLSRRTALKGMAILPIGGWSVAASNAQEKELPSDELDLLSKSPDPSPLDGARLKEALKKAASTPSEVRAATEPLPIDEKIYLSHINIEFDPDSRPIFTTFHRDHNTEYIAEWTVYKDEYDIHWSNWEQLQTDMWAAAKEWYNVEVDRETITNNKIINGYNFSCTRYNISIKMWL